MSYLQYTHKYSTKSKKIYSIDQEIERSTKKKKTYKNNKRGRYFKKLTQGKITRLKNQKKTLQKELKPLLTKIKKSYSSYLINEDKKYLKRNKKSRKPISQVAVNNLRKKLDKFKNTPNNKRTIKQIKEATLLDQKLKVEQNYRQNFYKIRKETEKAKEAKKQITTKKFNLYNIQGVLKVDSSTNLINIANAGQANMIIKKGFYEINIKSYIDLEKMKKLYFIDKLGSSKKLNTDYEPKLEELLEINSLFEFEFKDTLILNVNHNTHIFNILQQWVKMNYASYVNNYVSENNIEVMYLLAYFKLKIKKTRNKKEVREKSKSLDKDETYFADRNIRNYRLFNLGKKNKIIEMRFGREEYNMIVNKKQNPFSKKHSAYWVNRLFKTKYKYIKVVDSKTREWFLFNLVSIKNYVQPQNKVKVIKIKIGKKIL